MRLTAIRHGGVVVKRDRALGFAMPAGTLKKSVFAMTSLTCRAGSFSRAA